MEQLALLGRNGALVSVFQLLARTLGKKVVGNRKLFFLLGLQLLYQAFPARCQASRKLQGAPIIAFLQRLQGVQHVAAHLLQVV